MFNQGDILVDQKGNKRKVLGVCGEVYFVSLENKFNGYWLGFTEKEIKEVGYTLEKAEWEPKKGQRYFMVSDFGSILGTHWKNESYDNFRLSIGNCFQSEAEAEEYREKLKRHLISKNPTLLT